MKKNVFLICTVVSSLFSVVGQIEQANAKFNFEGQVAATTDGKGVFFNMGGPNVKFNFSKFSVAINMMPTLRFQEDKVKSVVTPMLGFGPQFYFLKDKRFLLSFPSYYNTGNNQWTFTAGLGYVLTKKKGVTKP
jgi:hypothetical protein